MNGGRGEVVVGDGCLSTAHAVYSHSGLIRMEKDFFLFFRKKKKYITLQRSMLRVCINGICIGMHTFFFSCIWL